MNIESFQTHCLSKKGVTEEFPFGEEVLVYKVLGKMFALTSLDSEIFRISLKCDPELAIQLREEYEGVQPGFHLNKKHWNTVTIDGSIKDNLIRDWIDHSYHLVLGSLPRRFRDTLM
ncbi:MAG: MmcQ/YjbR family DNA-binding protein [Spirosomataceae bacterium]